MGPKMKASHLQISSIGEQFGMYFSLVLSFCFVAVAFAAPASFTKSVPEPDLDGVIASGDMYIPDPKSPSKRNFMTGENRLWENAVVPFYISPELEESREKIYKAMNHISNRTCIRFRPKNDYDREYIFLFRGGSCLSWVGRRGRGMNVPVSLGFGCEELVPGAHEIIHSIGVYHTQSRSDRDKYLAIHWENMIPGVEPNYHKLDPSQNTLYTPFDFDSIMLYGPYMASRNGLRVMSALDPNQRFIDTYEKPGLSEWDIYSLNRLYKCEKYGKQFA